MKVEIETARVVSIANLGSDGTLFNMEVDPSEHVNIPFVDALRAYCDAVDYGADYFTVKDAS